MKRRKILSFLLVIATVLTTGIFAVMTANAELTQEQILANLKEYNELKYNIDYQDDAAAPINVKAGGFKAGQYADTPPAEEGGSAIVGAVHAADGSEYYIDLVNELIKVKDGMYNADGTPVSADFKAAAFISYDGGAKWKEVSIDPATGFSIAKDLKKDVNIVLTTDYDKKTKAPTVYKAWTLNSDSAEGASVWAFPTIKGRPKISKYTLDYYTYLYVEGKADVEWRDPESGNVTETFNQSNGQWTLSYTGTGGVNALEIAVGEGKVADAAGWGKFPAGAGLWVQNIDGSGKAVKSVFFVRVAPVLTGSYQAASALKKLSVSGVSKSPAYKIDYKNEVIKGKVGAEYQTTFDADAILNETTNEPTGEVSINWPEISSGGKPGADLKTVTDALKSGIPIIPDAAKPDVNNYGAYYRFRTVPSKSKPTKPASAWQIISVKEQDMLTVADVYGKFDFSKGKIAKTDKNVEFYDSTKKKWTSSAVAKTPNDKTTIVRLKSAAKYNSKTDITEGNTATNRIPMKIIWGKNEKGKDIVTGIQVDFAKSTPTENEIVFAAVAGGAPLTDKTLAVGSNIANFTLYFGENVDTTDLVNASLYNIGITGEGASTIGSAIVEIASPAADATSTTATVKVYSLSGANPVFTPGGLSIKLSVMDAASNLGKYAFWSESASCTLQATPNLTIKATPDGVGSIGATDVQVTAEASTITTASKEGKSDITFKVAADPIWALNTLEYLITSNSTLTADQIAGTGVTWKVLTDPGTQKVIGEETIESRYLWVRVKAGFPAAFSGNAAKTPVMYQIKSIEIQPGTAIANNGSAAVTVTGTAGTAITDTDITFKLTGDKFKALAAGTSVKTWFTNLPAGLDAKIKTAVADGDTTAVVTISGTPAAAANADMDIKIPSAALRSNIEIAAVTGSSKFNIAAAAPETTTVLTP